MQAFLTQDIDWGGHPGRASQSISPVLETRLGADRFHLAQAFLTQHINWGGHPERASWSIPPVLETRQGAGRPTLAHTLSPLTAYLCPLIVSHSRPVTSGIHK